MLAGVRDTGVPVYTPTMKGCWPAADETLQTHQMTGHQMTGHQVKLTDKRLCNGHGLDTERYSTHLRLECESVGRGGHSDRDLLNTIWTVWEAMKS